MRLAPVVLFFILLSCFGYAQGVRYQKVVGGVDEDYAYKVIPSPDGGSVMCGRTESFGAGGSDVYCIKVDSAGNTLWKKTYGGALEDIGYGLAATTDGGYLLVGSTQSFGSGVTDAYIIKVNEMGDTVWTKTYGGTGIDMAKGIIATNDSCFIIAGRTRSFGAGSDDAYLLKIDGDGKERWNYVIGGTGIDVVEIIEPTADGDFIVGGYTNCSGAGSFDVLLLKITTDGQIKWSKTIGKASPDYPKSIRQTSDGGFIILGATYATSSLYTDIYLVKVDSTGDVSWSKTMNGAEVTSDDEASVIYQLDDGGYMIGANTGFSDISSSLYVACLLRTKPDGEILWSKAFTSKTYGADMYRTPEGGYVMAGFMKHVESAGNYDVYVVKMDSAANNSCAVTDTSFSVAVGTAQTMVMATSVTSGIVLSEAPTIVGTGGHDSTLCFLTSITEPIVKSVSSVYPNPATDIANLATPILANETVYLVDLQGRKVIANWFRSSSLIKIDVKNVSEGIYQAIHMGYSRGVLQRYTFKVLVTH